MLKCVEVQEDVGVLCGSWLTNDPANLRVKKAACGTNIDLLPQVYPHLTGVTKFRDTDERTHKQTSLK